MFQVSAWTGIYEHGKEIIKVAFSTEKKEMLILYFAESGEKPPSLVGYVLLKMNISILILIFFLVDSSTS